MSDVDHLGADAAPCLLSDPSEGKEYTMYHGTSKEAAEKIQRDGFHQSADGMLGRGVYLSRDLEKASRYPLDLPEDQRVVLKVKVNVGKVKKIDSQNHPMRKTWHDHEYDTAWCPPNCGMVPSGLEEDCVWDPEHITVIDVIPSRLQNRLEPERLPNVLWHREAQIPQNLYFGAVVTRSHQTTRDPVSFIRQRTSRGMALSGGANAKKGNKRR
ncbi:uncharacterized protein LOC130552459 [Triplophysa rosa]|uniref:Grass carp reovirus GCRV-induced gene 2i n=1 Tax=Triplophysa rosa TaxID=992332 RepID=A0A9W8C8R9_TRIRA|nr:uncharacterized protein LOC130552459 [Triplophysa rosa]XP_057186741.1 uncharacterized protein LOC130552459 [Triplophysa rosa]KAI7810658.1 grass carp reovirus GCRV-induced gene 2i [Triplophysa rosa]